MLFPVCLLTALVCAVAKTTTDFVIVGSGTAGCTVAGLLCKQLPRATITLIERGEPRDQRARLQSEAAAKIFDAWNTPDLTDTLTSGPVRALGGRKLSFPNAVNYGGASAINAGQVMLPPTGTFDDWGIANLTDARAFNIFWERLRAAQPGTGVPPAELRPRFTDQWKRAAVASGFPYSPTPFKPPRNESASFDVRLTFDATGKRVDACRTFLRPVRGTVCKGRVRVLRGVRAERITFTRRRVARAVVATRVRDGKRLVLKARREVLVAAGAIESAALLLRSGIGPRAEIGNSTFRFVRDLPVGRRFQTRPIVTVSSRYAGPVADVNDPAQEDSARARRLFRAGRGGVLGKADVGPMARFRRVGYGFLNVGQFPQDAGKPVLLSGCIVDVSDRSFGRVKLARKGSKVADAGTPPVLDMKFWLSAGDVRRAGRCVMLLRRLQNELNPLINGTEVFGKGQSAKTLATRKGAEDKARGEMGTSSHYVGGCSVGRVVDSQLRVLGLKRLRVVDSGVIPRLPKLAGPIASVYIIAIHAADMITDAHPALV